MILQRELFSAARAPAAIPPRPAAPYIRTSRTSEAAARSIAPLSNVMRQRVLQYIISRGPLGATDQEISAGLGMLSDTARARRIELRDGGLIADSQQRRLSPSRRASTVWIAVVRAGIPREADPPAAPVDELMPWEIDDQEGGLP